MTRNELISSLKDIHSPVESAERLSGSVALWPIIVLVGLLTTFYLVRWWRRSAWRRQVRSELARVERGKDPHTRWHQLLELNEKIARLENHSSPLPVVAYYNPTTVGIEDEKRLAEHVRGLVKMKITR